MCDQHSNVPVDIPSATPKGHLGTLRLIDGCIADLVRVLNENGYPTRASCCGHGDSLGNIVLVDGRELLIVPDYETARRMEGHP